MWIQYFTCFWGRYISSLLHLHDIFLSFRHSKYRKGWAILLIISSFNIMCPIFLHITPFSKYRVPFSAPLIIHILYTLETPQGIGDVTSNMAGRFGNLRMVFDLKVGIIIYNDTQYIFPSRYRFFSFWENEIKD